MRLWVGFDVGKASHWVCVLDEEGEVVLSRRVKATEDDVEECWSEIESLGGEERTVALDLMGGAATMLEAVLLSHGERVFFLPGMAVNRARDGYRGEQKSDERDAKVIADQLRMRWRSLREVFVGDEEAAEMRTLLSYRRDLVGEQARSITRLRVLLRRSSPAWRLRSTSPRTGL